MTGGRCKGWLPLLAVVLLAGCAGQNPLAGLWPFGRPEVARAPTAAPLADRAAAAEATVPVGLVRLAAAEPGRHGVILRAEGVAPTQGYHSPELRPVGRGEDGVEVVELRARPPEGEEAVGPARTRLLSVGRFYPAHEMAGIRGFRVVAAENSASIPAP